MNTRARPPHQHRRCHRRDRPRRHRMRHREGPRTRPGGPAAREDLAAPATVPEVPGRHRAGRQGPGRARRRQALGARPRRDPVPARRPPGARPDQVPVSLAERAAGPHPARQELSSQWCCPDRALTASPGCRRAPGLRRSRTALVSTGHRAYCERRRTRQPVLHRSEPPGPCGVHVPGVRTARVRERNDAPRLRRSCEGSELVGHLGRAERRHCTRGVCAAGG